MFIKLAIIVGIVILGGMMFSTEIENLFPSTANPFCNLFLFKQRLSYLLLQVP